MQLDARLLFYERQYRGHEYAALVDSRPEALALEAFIKTCDLRSKRVLEIGCGRGAFKNLVERWVGLDLAATDAGGKGKPIVRASAIRLPFANDSFDGLWSITTLEHVPQPEAALEEIARVMKPGGVAYLAPAWHCRPWAADGYAVRPWSDFGWKGKLIKASIPLRNALWFRALTVLPTRTWREALFFLTGRRPTPFRYRALEANYHTYWCADSDACNSMDPHEMLLWFSSRGWSTPSHSTLLRRFLVRHDAVVVGKPLAVSPVATAAPASPNRRRFRLAVVASHPIQYQAPLFRALAAHPEIDLTVFFYSDYGARSYRDPGFGHEVKWDISLLNGYRFEILPNISPRPNPSRFWGLINPGIVTRLRNGSFDAVWVHGWGRATDWLVMLAAFALGVPVLLRGETNLLPPLPEWKRRLKRAVLTRLFRHVSGFLTIGRYNADFYRDYGVAEDRMLSVPYAVDNDFFSKQARQLLSQKRDLRQKLGIPEDLPVVLFCGKLTPVKRPMDLLEAFARATADHPALLVYVGDGPLRPQLESYVERHHLKHIYLMGFRNQTELPRFYALADVFVLPSGFEPWGLVVNEAMCFGLPVIVSDQVGAGGDLVQHGTNGLIFPAGDVAALAQALGQVLHDPASREQMGSASRSRIEDWSFESDARGVLRAIERLQRLRDLVGDDWRATSTRPREGSDSGVFGPTEEKDDERRDDRRAAE